MEDFPVTLKLLTEILIKKKHALITILNICENEETAFLMAEEKQKQINMVLETDNVFTSVFERIRDKMEEKSAEFPAEFSRLQSLINEVCELDVKIRAQEEKNKSRLTRAKTENQPAVPVNKVAGMYAKNRNIKKE